MHRVLHDLGSDAALADQQTLVDEFLDRAPASSGRDNASLLANASSFSKRSPGARSPLRIDSFDRLGELVVEGNRAGPVELNS